MTLKILNLYAGIGGNRKLWTGDIEVTAVELNPKIAKIYQDNFSDDKVIIEDAHKYLLEHFEEFDFIWSSPPCPSHSHIRKELAVYTGQNKPIYPDMKLYEEILLLQHFFKGKFVIDYPREEYQRSSSYFRQNLIPSWKQIENRNPKHSMGVLYSTILNDPKTSRPLFFVYGYWGRNMHKFYD